MLTNKKKWKYFLINKICLIKLQNLICIDKILIQLKNSLIEKKKIFKVLNIINILNQKPIKLQWENKNQFKLIFNKMFTTITYMHNYFFFMHTTLSFNNSHYVIKKYQQKKNIWITIAFSNLELGILLAIKEPINLKFNLFNNNPLIKLKNFSYLINIL